MPLYKAHDSSKSPENDENSHGKCASVLAQPVLVDLPKNATDESLDSQYSPIAVNAGVSHSLLKTNDGTLLGAGWNKYGQISSELSEENVSNFRVINTNFGDSYEVICGEWSTISIVN